MTGTTKEPRRVTATMAAMRDTRLRFAYRRLLDRLLPFMRAWPMKQDEELPEHDLGWVTGVDGLSPEAEIMDALRVSPEIWMKLLPEGVCIVSRERLAQLAQGIPWSTDLLELEGVATVEHYAAKRLNEIEALERDKRRGLQR